MDKVTKGCEISSKIRNCKKKGLRPKNMISEIKTPLVEFNSTAEDSLNGPKDRSV